MTEFFYTILGSIIAIIVTGVFNLITSKRQHKMEIHRIAVQNKLETSKTAIGWLSSVKSELSIVIWAVEHKSELAPGMMAGVLERANRLTTLEQEARDFFNAIELYYDLEGLGKRYNLEAMIPQLLSLQNSLADIANFPANYTTEESEAILDTSLQLLKNLHVAVSEAMEIIRKDNLHYVK